ncbi:hypothetical protein ACWDR9_38750, partial [Streptosporangium sandarakinum]
MRELDGHDGGAAELEDVVAGAEPHVEQLLGHGGDVAHPLPSVMYQVLNTDPALEGMEPALRDLVARAL